MFVCQCERERVAQNEREKQPGYVIQMANKQSVSVRGGLKRKKKILRKEK